MSKKINISNVLCGHFSTLTNAQGRIALIDIFTFYIFPTVIAILCAYFALNFNKDTINVLVTVGSILTGLLLNLLVLVYDQKSKLPPVDASQAGWEVVQIRHNVLQELYYNISYATLVSLLVAILSVLHLAVGDSKIHLKFEKYINVSVGPDFCATLITPFIVALGINLVLTILMIIKRIYTLLTTEK